MLKNKEIIIGKYLSGNASQEETQLLLNWMKSSEQNQSEFEAAEKIWKASARLKKERDYDVNAAWNEFESLKQNKRSAVIKPMFIKQPWIRVAAAVTLFAVLGLVLKFVFLSDNSNTPKGISLIVPPKAEIPELATDDLFDTANYDNTIIEEPVKAGIKSGKTKTRKQNVAVTPMVVVETGDSAKIFMLPDNSLVYLNAHSRLEYPENFVRSERTATLSGEAFFEVAEGSEPFKVTCDKTLTDGLLSSFNIKSEAEKDVEIIVVSGTAGFSGIGSKDFKKLTLKAGESGTYTKGLVIKAKHTRKNYKWWQRKNLRARIKQLFERLRNTLK